jgi:hypothetical protein
MKHFLVAAALAVLISATGTASALDRKVRISNSSDYDIVEFYASNTGRNNWEEDILGADILPSGSSVMVNIDDGSGYCRFDFKAVFEDGDEAISSNNNVCELSEFEFTN